MLETGNETAHFRIAPSLRGQVVALRAQGRSKARIARELGINRRTVDKVIREYVTDTQQCTVVEHVRRIIPKSLDCIEENFR